LPTLAEFRRTQPLRQCRERDEDVKDTRKAGASLYQVIKDLKEDMTGGGVSDDSEDEIVDACSHVSSD
jgi:hypothetical protein